MTGEARGTGANFAVLYQVTECRKVRGKIVEWRERVVVGTTLYQVAQTTFCNAAMLEVVAKGAEALATIARVEDEKAKKKKRATPARKRR